MMELSNNVFIEEANELLTDLESSLLELEQDPTNEELIGSIFRALHTIKGSGAMFGFDEISAFTHDIETLFDLVREGKIAVSKELIDLAIASRDQIKAMLDADIAGELYDVAYTAEITSKLQAFIPDNDGFEANQQEGSSEVQSQKQEVTYRITFKPSQDIFKTGTNPILLLNELRSLGECIIIGHTDEIPTLSEIDFELCYVYWTIILTTNADINTIKDVFIFVEDDSVIEIDMINYDEKASDDDENYKKLGEILVERGYISEDKLTDMLKTQKPIGQILVEAGLVTSEQVESSLVEQDFVRKQISKVGKSIEASSIRVPTERVDKLVNLVGELVTVQASLTQSADKKDYDNLEAIAEEVENLTQQLRDCALNMRMLPIGPTFSKFKRLVRDLSDELGKEVDLEIEGAETELDKTMIEKLNEPLVHLIRNSLDHGIETPEERETVGKPRKGTVLLSASHSGTNVIVKVSDDGKGIDQEKIRLHAIEKELISENAELSEKEIFDLILMPGFSTTNEITNLSGRGVGMDVVKRNIEQIRGSIDIMSEEGKGTEIQFRLPLTLGIIEGLLVKIAEERFVVPLATVESCMELIDSSNGNGQNRRRLLNIQSELVPYIHLREYFEFQGSHPGIEHVVITKEDDSKVGFVVDEILGEQQVVVKPLGKMYREVEGLSGGTVLGDGTVGLILDVPKLMEKVEEAEMESVANNGVI